MARIMAWSTAAGNRCTSRLRPTLWKRGLLHSHRHGFLPSTVLPAASGLQLGHATMDTSYRGLNEVRVNDTPH